jgi:AraC-like DNA-binding protein
VKDERPVWPVLREWIAQISVEWLDAPQLVLDEPDHATTLVLRTLPGKATELVVMGPRTRPLHYTGRPGPSCVKVRLQPGQARLLLGRSVRDLADQVVPLREISGEPGQRLARDWADPRQFAEALVAGAPPHRGSDRSRSQLVRSAAGLLATTDIRTSAQRLHVSERHLRNLFADGVGVAPKRFARIQRVRTVLAHAERRPLSELAAEAGYYDHSHMTSEFRAIMGVPPSAFLRGELPATTGCGPADVG